MSGRVGGEKKGEHETRHKNIPVGRSVNLNNPLY